MLEPSVARLRKRSSLIVIFSRESLHLQVISFISNASESTTVEPADLSESPTDELDSPHELEFSPEMKSPYEFASRPRVAYAQQSQPPPYLSPRLYSSPPTSARNTTGTTPVACLRRAGCPTRAPHKIAGAALSMLLSARETAFGSYCRRW